MLIDLTLNEVETLVEWHRSKQWEESGKECYLDAAFHQNRVSELIKCLNETPNA